MEDVVESKRIIIEVTFEQRAFLDKMVKQGYKMSSYIRSLIDSAMKKGKK